MRPDVLAITEICAGCGPLHYAMTTVLSNLTRAIYPTHKKLPGVLPLQVFERNSGYSRIYDILNARPPVFKLADVGEYIKHDVLMPVFGAHEGIPCVAITFKGRKGEWERDTNDATTMLTTRMGATLVRQGMVKVYSFEEAAVFRDTDTYGLLLDELLPTMHVCTMLIPGWDVGSASYRVRTIGMAMSAQDWSAEALD